MSRRVLVIEPDAAGRAMMDRVLTSGGLAADSAASAHEAQPLLDRGDVEAIVVDELAGSRGALEEVRWLRARYPTIPVVVTGALLSRREMQELVRLRVADVLAKPFTPTELRDATARALEQKTAHREEGLEYDASLTDARRAIAAGLTDRARAPLTRAHAMSPFDSEVMALFALLAELAGEDSNADRGYRAALALRDEEACAAPDPHEGLARLAAYGAAVPVRELSKEPADRPIWIVSDPAAELRAGALEERGPHLVVASLGITSDERGAVFYRERPARDRGHAPTPGPRAFALLACALRVESVAAALRAHPALGRGPLRTTEPTSSRFDVARAEALRLDPGS